MIGTRRDLGLGRRSGSGTWSSPLRRRAALVHVDVDDVGARLRPARGRPPPPPRTCRLRISRANFFEPVTLVRSPIMMKLLSGRSVSGSSPLKPRQRLDCGRRARRLAGHGLGNRADVRRRGAAAAADDVQPAVVGELAQRAGHHLGRFVEAAEGVRQAGVRITTDVNRRDLRQLFDIRPQLAPVPARSSCPRSAGRHARSNSSRLRPFAPRACGPLRKP